MNYNTDGFKERYTYINEQNEINRLNQIRLNNEKRKRMELKNNNNNKDNFLVKNKSKENAAAKQGIMNNNKGSNFKK